MHELVQVNPVDNVDVQVLFIALLLALGLDVVIGAHVDDDFVGLELDVAVEIAYYDQESENHENEDLPDSETTFEVAEYQVIRTRVRRKGRVRVFPQH